MRSALNSAYPKRTCPYRPQADGKIKRLYRTLAEEWAYARLYLSDAERCAEFPPWLHYCNDCESWEGWSGTGWQG